LAPPTPAPNAAMESQKAAIESQKAAVAALQSRDDSAEELAQRALRAAEAAQAAASAAKTNAEAAAKASPAPAAAVEQGEPGALTASELMTALEGRIDELGNETKALRERLESSKGETRAAPDATAATAAKTPDGPAAIVVVAFALQRELEAGRPYALETKALTRLGADPAALAALSPLAEKGAPTAAQLKTDFAPAAKRIRALESGASGDLTEHLMKGASKLVRVRPSGQAPTTEAQTVEEKVAHIEAALTHGDLAQASAVFAALPEAAQNEAKDFGATLRARVDAGRAADDLLHGAIAALGATKE
ncbi:COG4223 family protein, partial [Methylocystis sp.]|uniref:COG4223 family protein n=1 Tax=Methylocystis sp. TaxID=1911079 RepID=UPI00273242ED